MDTTSTTTPIFFKYINKWALKACIGTCPDHQVVILETLNNVCTIGSKFVLRSLELTRYWFVGHCLIH